MSINQTSAPVIYENGMVTSDYQITVTSDAYVSIYDQSILANAISNAITLTLPTATEGKIIYIKKIDASSNLVTAVPSGSEKIDGLTSVLLRTQNEGIELKGRLGVGWIVSSTLSTFSDGAIASKTMGSLSFNVDYNLAGAVDPPPGLIFSTQAQADAYLSSAGATAFKHLKLIYEATPKIYDHDVIYYLAAGIHRPDPSGSSGLSAWRLTTKIFTTNGNMSIVGAAPSSWTPVVVSQVITSHQVGSGDPYIDFAGTPFIGLDLKGLYAVLSTGQTALIHDHTDSRLYVTQLLSPAPTNGVSTCFVSSPSTILRNSANDTSSFNAVGGIELSSTISDINMALISLQDITFDPFSTIGIIFRTPLRVIFTRVHFDAQTSRQSFGINTNGQMILTSGIGNLSVTTTTCSFRDLAPSSTSWLDEFIRFDSIGSWVFSGCFFRGSEDGIQFSKCLVTFTNTVFDNMGSSLISNLTGGYFHAINGSEIRFFTASNNGKRNEFRNMPSPRPAVCIERAYIPDRSSGAGATSFPNQELVFKNCAGPCVRISAYGHIEIPPSSSGFLDGTGNLDVGFDMVGPHASLKILDTNTNLAGTLGAVRLPGPFIIPTITDITANDGYVHIGKGITVER